MSSVSAIVSAYYAEQYLPGRLANLSGQYPQPEIIVVAEKGSREAEIAKQFENVMYILTDGIPTIYHAWNLAIMASNCDYITNANCDDYVYPNMYHHMASILDANPDCAVVYGDNDIRVASGEVTHHKRMEGGFETLLKYCFVGPFPMWRKSLHDQYGYFNATFTSAGDYEYWLRIAQGGEKFYHIRQSVGLYLKRSDSLEFRNRELSILEAKRIRRVYGG
jgi:hypothetical protein